MICLDITDTLEGGASVDAVVDYTVHGLVGSVFTQIVAGRLSDTDPSVLYTAGAAISIVSIIFVNTHSAAVAVNLYLDPANGGNPRRMIPKDLSLGIGYSLHFDGQRCTVLDASGRILKGYAAHAAEHKDGGADDLLSAPGAIGGTTPAAGEFTTLGASGLISADGGQIAFPAAAVPSADPNTLDDYEEGTFTPTFTSSGGAFVSWGFYTKIGNVCNISAYLSSIASTAGAGVVNIGAIPFTSLNVNYTKSALSVGELYVVNWIATAKNFCVKIEPNQTVIIPLWNRDDTSALQSVGTDFDGNCSMHIAGHYWV